MDISQLKPNGVVRGPILPEPVQVIINLLAGICRAMTCDGNC